MSQDQGQETIKPIEPLRSIELNRVEQVLLIDALSREIIASAENLGRVTELSYLLIKVTRQ